jgi:putative transposase
MFGAGLASIQHLGMAVLEKVQNWIRTRTKPATTSQVLETACDLLRSKTELVAENALLRQQVIVLKRGVKQPKLTGRDRWLMVLLASKLPHWKQAILIIQPATLLRWHRDLFKWVWRHTSHHTGGRPPLSDETIALIRQMATENRLWGAKRIRGELLKLGLRVSKSSIQKYIDQVRPPRCTGPTSVLHRFGLKASA